jgi:hypothetical protein
MGLFIGKSSFVFFRIEMFLAFPRGCGKVIAVEIGCDTGAEMLGPTNCANRREGEMDAALGFPRCQYAIVATLTRHFAGRNECYRLGHVVCRDRAEKGPDR